MSRNPVHLYRSLLRETTYLPDPNCRLYLSCHITSSFRRYLPRDRGNLPKCRTILVTPERQTLLFRQARKTLSILQHANDGSRWKYEKILKLTYARTGRRRRQLMQQLMTEPSNDELTDLKKTTRYTESWSPPSSFKTLLQSQSQIASHNLLPYVSRKVILKRPDPQTKNIWGRPMPKKRLRNQTRKWYSWNADMLYLPLPEKEREHIRAIALGENKLEQKNRRTRGRISVFARDEDGIATQASSPSSGATMNKSVVGGQKQKTSKVRPRFYRRQMMRLFKHIPLPQAHKEEGKPVVMKWEGARPSRLAVQEADDRQRAFLFG